QENIEHSTLPNLIAAALLRITPDMANGWVRETTRNLYLSLDGKRIGEHSAARRAESSIETERKVS
ncbi:hypothetical protein BGZ73_002402, partial [Actinomortierella ambigua]